MIYGSLTKAIMELGHLKLSPPRSFGTATQKRVSASHGGKMEKIVGNKENMVSRFCTFIK